MHSSGKDIILTEDLVIGKGAHKTTYHHPTENNLCIKILHKMPDVDLEREMAYRKSRQRRKLTSTMLPKYFGTVNTNLGTGYIFEKVCDYDSSNSLNIQEFIESKDFSAQHIYDITAVLMLFKELFFKEKIITTNMQFENFLIQRVSSASYTIRIIDNIGSPVLIPLAFYIDYFAVKHVSKYWQRFMDMLVQTYPDLMTQELIDKIK